MKIKDLRINQVGFYYQTYEGKTEEVDEDGNYTGETTISYSDPVYARARISPNSGEAALSPFGADLKYDRQLSTVQDLDIDEHTRLFVDVVPEINNDGSTDTEPDFECVAVAKDLQQNVWALRRLTDAN